MRNILSTIISIGLFSHNILGKPSADMCASFAKHVEKWNPLPETLLSWSKSNCDKIQPRPADMTCDDVVQFVEDCDFSSPTNRRVADQFYSQTYNIENKPRVLPKYIYYNENTAKDFGQFGQWYYPNYYPPSYLGFFDGRHESMQQLENDLRFAKGGHYYYNRADNIVNIGLQQTSLPTCLHDLFYCVRAQIGQRPQAYLNYHEYRRDRDAVAAQQEAEEQARRQSYGKRKHHHHRRHRHEDDDDE